MVRKDNKKQKKQSRPEPGDELRDKRKKPAVSKPKYNNPKQWLNLAGEDDEDDISDGLWPKER